MNVHSIFIDNSKNWYQPRYLSTGEWLNKLWYIHIMEYDSTMKRNQLDMHNNLDESTGNYAE